MLCVFSLFIYSLKDIQKVTRRTCKIIILILYLYFASAPKLYLKLIYKIVIYNLHYTLHFAGLKR